MNSYRFLKFSDGWWAVKFFPRIGAWGRWRGPFETKGDAQLDCMNASGERYQP